MKKFLFSILFSIPVLTYGQYHLTLFQLHETVPQASQLNPALLPNGQVNIGFPGTSNIYFGLSNSFSAQEIFYLNEDNELIPDIEAFKSSIRSQNYLRANTQVDPIYIGFWAKRNYFSFSMAAKTNFSFGYPSELIIYALEGNGGSNLGVEASFDDLAFKTSGYLEYSLGFGRALLNNKLQFGIRAKYLKGMYNVSLDKGITGSIHTHPQTYDVTVKLDDVVLHTAGVNALDIDLFPEDEGGSGGSSNNPDRLEEYLFNNNNNGYALDIGASLRLSRYLKLYASVIDLGYIKWQSEVKSYSIHDAEYTFRGVDLRNYDSFEEETLDSLKTMFKPVEDELSYSESLSSKFYIGGEYQLGRHHTVGLLGYGRFFKGKLNPALSINYNLKLGKTFNTALTYSIMNGSYDNIGWGFSLNAGFLQIYAVTDNILAYVKPQAAQNADLRLGINMTFGRKRHERIMKGLPGNKKKAAQIENEEN